MGFLTIFFSLASVFHLQAALHLQSQEHGVVAVFMLGLATIFGVLSL